MLVKLHIVYTAKNCQGMTCSSYESGKPVISSEYYWEKAKRITCGNIKLAYIQGIAISLTAAKVNPLHDVLH